MKKTLSIVLAVLMMALTFIPAISAAGNYTVEFVAPSSTLETVNGVAPYSFVKCSNGTYLFQVDENGEYVCSGKRSYKECVDLTEEEMASGFYDLDTYWKPVKDSKGEIVNYEVTVLTEAEKENIPAGIYYCGWAKTYVLVKDVLNLEECVMPDYDTETRYSPITWDSINPVAEGEIVAFAIRTNEVYNAGTAAVYVNGEQIKPETNGEYRVYVDRDLQISVNDAPDVLLRNMFAVNMTSGDGYKVKTISGENYSLVPYGGSFRFRVKISKGYTDAGMTVKVLCGTSGLSEFIGEEFDSAIALLPSDQLEGTGVKVITLSSDGVDADGYRTYTIPDIKDNCKIMVSGVRKESTSGILAMFKRILKLILDFLGIQSDIFGSITATYDVNINASDSEMITYAVTSGNSTDEVTPTAFTVASGDSVTVQVATTYANCDQHVEVKWVYTNANGEKVTVDGNKNFDSKWVAQRNKNTGAIYYTRVFVIDNITSDTTISITEIK